MCRGPGRTWEDNGTTDHQGNGSPTDITPRYRPPSLRWLKRKTANAKSGQGSRTPVTISTRGGMKWRSCLEKSIQTLNTNLLCDSAIRLPGVYKRATETCPRKHSFVNFHGRFIFHNEEQNKCPFTDMNGQWMNRQWMEYSTQWNIIQQQKGMCCGDLKQCEWISEFFCLGNEARRKRVCTIWSYLCKTLEKYALICGARKHLVMPWAVREMFGILIVVVVLWMYTTVKTSNCIL